MIWVRSGCITGFDDAEIIEVEEEDMTTQERLDIEDYIGFNDIINNKVEEKIEKIKTFRERLNNGHYDSIKNIDKMEV